MAHGHRSDLYQTMSSLILTHAVCQNLCCLVITFADNLDKDHNVPDLKVIKLEYILRLKIKRTDLLIADTCPQSANHCTYFESENEPRGQILTQMVLCKDIFFKKKTSIKK